MLALVAAREAADIAAGHGLALAGSPARARRAPAGPPQPADEPARRGRAAGYRSKHRRAAAPEDDAPLRTRDTREGTGPSQDKDGRRRAPRHAAPASALVSARNTNLGVMQFPVLGAHR